MPTKIPSAQPPVVTNTRPVYREKPKLITTHTASNTAEPSLRPQPAPPQR
jgi:hypothetical protein